MNPAPRNASKPSLAPAGARPVTLRVNIDRLTLPGLSRGDAARVVSSLQRSLGELANQTPGRDWSNASAIDSVDGGTIPPGARPREIGSHLAAQIFRRLG